MIADSARHSKPLPLLEGERQHRMYIGGEWVATAGDRWLAVLDPAVLTVIGEAPDGGQGEARSAVDAAAAAFSEWASLAGRERARYLLRLGERMRESSDDLARVVTAEVGKPLRQARDEARSAAAFVSWYGEEAKRAYGTVIPSAQRDKRVWVVRQPAGVAAAITPWNFPLGLIARKVGAALAAGCTVVVKPAPETPLSGLAFAALAEDVGLPPGVLNVVTGDAATIAQTWLADPRVRRLSFTGSTAVGRLLVRAAAERLPRVSLELGGSAPYVVFPDADLDKAVDGLSRGKIRNAGQVCAAPNRIYVHESIADEFVGKLQAMVDRVRVGNGVHPESQMGPLINEEGYRKVEEMVADATRRGAEVHTGGTWVGEPETRTGWFWRPQVLVGAPEDCTILREEAFGPVLSVLRFSEEAEVVERANRSPYGLGAYVFTRDLNRAVRMAEALDAGIVGINDPLPAAVEAPFGGLKESGYGREGGAEGLAEFTEEKTVSLQLD